MLRKKDKMPGKPRILSLFFNSFDKFNKHEHSCKILYLYNVAIFYLFELMLYVPINNFSVRLRCFLGWTSNKHRIK